MIWHRVRRLFRHGLAIDLGAVNTLIYSRGHGIILNEPSAIALNRFTGEVIAVGREARWMLGREPRDVGVHRPIQNGVVADYDLTEQMLRTFLRRAGYGRHWPGRRLEAMISIPGSATHVERKALAAAAQRAGLSRVSLVEEGVAAAIGADALFRDSRARLVVNIGGGTTDLSLVSSAGVISSRSIDVAGLAMDQAIQEYVRRKYKLSIGEQSAEAIKIALGMALSTPEERTYQVVGISLIDHEPQEIHLYSGEVTDALQRPIQTIIDSIHQVMSEAPREVSMDVFETGIVLTGGGSLLRELDTRFRQEFLLPVVRAECPVEAVVLGAAYLLDHPALLERFQVSEKIPSWELETETVFPSVT